MANVGSGREILRGAEILRVGDAPTGEVTRDVAHIACGSTLAIPSSVARFPFWLATVLVVACEPLDSDMFVPPTPPDPVGAATPAESAAASAAPAPSALSDADDAALDPRASRASPRPSALLMTEVTQLAALFRATPANAADRTQVMRRLAEDYVELAHSFARDATDPTQPESKVAEMVAVRRQQSRVAENAAITIYETLLRYEKLRGEPQLDEVRYFLALEEARAGEPAAARRAANDLVTSGDSPWRRRAETLLAKLGGRIIIAPPPTVTTTTTTTPPPPPPKPVVANAKTARACSTSFDCPGAQMCEDNQCVDELGK